MERISGVDGSLSVGDNSEVEGDLAKALEGCVVFGSREIFVVTCNCGLLSFSTNSSLERTGSARKVSASNDCGGID